MPNKTRALVLLHTAWLAALAAVWWQAPFVSSGAARDAFGQVVGMATVAWNPWLGWLSVLVLPLAVLAWRWARGLLLVHVLVLIWVVYWLGFAKLPDPCDYTKPILARLAVCG